MEKTENNQTNSKLATLTAILIGVVTVLGAVIAWRASVAADGAGDADFDGLKASLNAEETRALNFVNAYEHYGAYIDYARNIQLGDALAEDLQNAVNLSEQEHYLLDRQRAEAYDVGDANQDLFPNRFLNRDGSYSVEREIGELWADASKEKDLYPDEKFAAADQLRAKSNNLIGTITLLGIGLVFFTLVEGASRKSQTILFGLGALFSVAGTVIALVIEFAK